MRRFLVRAQPSFDRLLLIESGPREAGDKALQLLYKAKNASHVDLLTCYSTAPDGFDYDRGTVYSVHDREAVENRTKFISKLANIPYTVVAILCTGSPILERWKWTLALRTSARLVVVNEEANYFTLDFWNLGTARLMLRKRISDRGLALASDSGLALASLRAIMAWLLAPFIFAYLATYTGIIHLKRWNRIRKAAAS